LEEWERIVPPGTPGEIVVAFRGTDGTSLRDWRANLSPIEPEQFRESVQYMRQVTERADKEGSTVTVTGHSLGGAIALNMSLRFRNVDYVGFNPSPRGYAKVFFRPRHTASRLTVTERGEVLRTGFIFVPYLPVGAFYNIDRLRYDFIRFTSGVIPVQEHSMYLFSRGLLLAAIKDGDIQARRTFRTNFSHVSLHQAFSPGDPTHDIAYCQRIFSEAGQEDPR
jgi:pimeloyl-ACP methyl ester carboxylesterase